MLAWLRDLTGRERQTMLACWAGWTLDGFDQQLYSYVVPTVIGLWGLSKGAAGTIGTVTWGGGVYVPPTTIYTGDGFSVYVRAI